MGSIRPMDQSHNGLVNYMQMIRSMQFWIVSILSTPSWWTLWGLNVICPAFFGEICQWNMAPCTTNVNNAELRTAYAAILTGRYKSQIRWNVTHFVVSADAMVICSWYSLKRVYVNCWMAAAISSLARWKLRNLGIFFWYLSRCTVVACSFLGRSVLGAISLYIVTNCVSLFVDIVLVHLSSHVVDCNARTFVSIGNTPKIDSYSHLFACATVVLVVPHSHSCVRIAMNECRWCVELKAAAAVKYVPSESMVSKSNVECRKRKMKKPTNERRTGNAHNRCREYYRRAGIPVIALQPTQRISNPLIS